MKVFALTVSLMASSVAFGAAIPIRIPSDSNAEYSILEKQGSGSERTITTKRTGSSGTTYSRRLYNCAQETFKYLGTGESFEAMASASPDPVMSAIVQGSISYYVGLEACR